VKEEEMEIYLRQQIEKMNNLLVKLLPLVSAQKPNFK
jgi:hypothetical protein